MNKNNFSSQSENIAGKAWVVNVNMGYGHQRTSYPLRDIAFLGKIFNANSYEGITESDKAIWSSSRSFYEFISNFKRIPLIGNFAFSIFDVFQKILNFYPKRDLSKPDIILKQIFSLISRGWGRDLIEKFKNSNLSLPKPLPLVSTFFTPAFMAEYFNYPGQIFCVICDADISRTWAPLKPKTSRIKYFASTERTEERLKLYGVPAENIYLTGYPLPKEMIGKENTEVLKEDLKNRIINLDPRKKYLGKYKALINEQLGELPGRSDHPLTIMFSVGGAGAQKEIGIKIIQGLADKIKEGSLKIFLSAGIKEKVRDYFEDSIKKLGLEDCLEKSIEIVFARHINDYFYFFNEALRKTDILWTKPSELSFYAALGLPIIISPAIGYQEEFNQRWLLKSGFGMLQENPAYIRQWFFDWLEQGYLAEAAMQGFIEGDKMGTFNIEKIIANLV